MGGLDDKTFLIGIGAQKAGTSWLYDYLAAHPDCFMSPIKELHYFDAVFRPDLPMPMNEILRRTVGRLKRVKDLDVALTKGLLPLVERLEMTYDKEAYRRYFETRVQEDVSVYGEITPSYALLPVRGFQTIKKQFPDVKVVYILRDPIDRQVSQMRMKARKRYTSVPVGESFFKTMATLAPIVTAHPQSSALDRYEAALQDPHTMERSLYHQTFRRLDKVFTDDEISVFFYETLFQDKELKRFCDAVGLPFVPGDYGKTVNSGGEKQPNALSPEHLAVARECLSEVYDFCADRFGDAVPDSWHV